MANANYYGTLSVLAGNGDGTLQDQVIFPVGADPSSIAVGDFTGEGKPDLAVANYGHGNYPDYGTGNYPKRVSVFVNWWGATATVSVTGVSVPGTGTHQIKAYFPGDANYRQAHSAPIPLPATP